MVDIVIELVAGDKHYKPLKLLPVSLSSQMWTLNVNNLKIIIQSGLVRSWVTRNLPAINIKLMLQSSKIDIELKEEDILLTQVVVSQGFVIKTSQTFNINKSLATYETTNQTLEQIKLHGPAFEILYIIELKNKSFQVTVNLEHFEIKIPQIDKNLLKQGPFFALADPQYDAFNCPENYEYDEKEK